MPKNRKLAQLSLVIASLLLVGVFTLILLEKNNVTKFFTNTQNTEESVGPQPVNTVSYTPASSTEQQEGEALKQQLINESNRPANSQSISVNFSAANQDVVGGPVIIKALINGATNGTCKLVMVKDGTEKTYTASVTNLGTYYGCDGFSVPVSDISAGSWKVLLTVTSGGSSGSTEQVIEVSL